MMSTNGIEFDGKRTFSVGNGFGKSCIIFGVDMSSSVHVDNKQKVILVLRGGPTKGLDSKTLTAEKKYSINFTENNKKLCISLHYNGANSYLFINGIEIKSFEIVATPFCLRNISKDFSVDNMKKAKLNGIIYDLSVDYDAIAVDDILDIHKYLMEKNGII